MKYFPFFYLITLILLAFPLKKSYSQNPRSQELFDDNWKFYKGDAANAEREDFDDKDWRNVELPHDWSIEDLPNQSDSIIGPFSKSSVGGTSTGYTTGGTAWYRKSFIVKDSSNKKVSVYFDGVYMNSDVWINGHHLGNHPYGYTGFSYDLTPYLNPAKGGKQNVIAVKVRNEGKNSRWYSGSGIHRHVWLTITNLLHIPQWGVFITTPNVSESAATVNIKTSIAGELDITPVILRTRLLDATGKTVAVTEKKLTISNKTNNNVYQSLQINNPRLWSPDDPYLYKSVSEVLKTGKVTDVVVSTFGVRSIQFNAATGFLLNGKKTLLRGGSVHHDNGPLGSAAIDRAEERKVELLKSFGFNAVRTSHNPPSGEFLNACDKLGLLVIDEAFDQWQKPKNPQDYHLFFNEWWRKDLSSMVMRDRNHPSVIIWSIGNEIKERADSSGLAIAKQMSDEVYSLDSSRPVTQAICDFWDNPGYKWDTTKYAFALLDIGSYNYMWKQYEDDHEKFPQRIMAGTESFAKEAFENWQQVEKHPYVIGDFVWTAMDYMGETAIGHSELDTIKSVIQPWPWFNAYCGDIDLIGNKKPQSYYRDIIWKRRKMAMLVHTPVPEGHKEVITKWGWPDEYPSWNFQGEEGKPLQVRVYTRYPAVRLELNGNPIAQKTLSTQDNFTALFNVTYKPGELKAIGLQDGKATDSVILRTTGRPKQIRLTPDRNRIQSHRNDLSFVTAEILDEKGQVVPDGVIQVHFTIKGNGEIAATGNANPADMASFSQAKRNTFRGRGLVIIRPNGKAGSMTITAKAKDLRTGETVIISNDRAAFEE